MLLVLYSPKTTGRVLSSRSRATPLVPKVSTGKLKEAEHVVNSLLNSFPNFHTHPKQFTEPKNLCCARRVEDYLRGTSGVESPIVVALQLTTAGQLVLTTKRRLHCSKDVLERLSDGGDVMNGRNTGSIDLAGDMAASSRCEIWGDCGEFFRWHFVLERVRDCRAKNQQHFRRAHPLLKVQRRFKTPDSRSSRIIFTREAANLSAMRSLVLLVAFGLLVTLTHAAFMQPFKPAGMFSGARLAKFSPMLRSTPLTLRRPAMSQLKMTAAPTEKFEFQVRFI